MDEQDLPFKLIARGPDGSEFVVQSYLTREEADGALSERREHTSFYTYRVSGSVSAEL